MVAAFGDEVARNVELSAAPSRWSCRRGGGVGQCGAGAASARRGRRRAGQGLERRERQPRAFQRAIAEIRSRHRLVGDLLRRHSRSRAAPAQSPTARQKAARASGPRGTYSLCPEAREAIDRLVELFGGRSGQSSRVILARKGWRNRALASATERDERGPSVKVSSARVEKLYRCCP